MPEAEIGLKLFLMSPLTNVGKNNKNRQRALLVDIISINRKVKKYLISIFK